MKRVIAAALAALVLASSPAEAGRLLIIRNAIQESGATDTAYGNYLNSVTAACDALGIEYDVVAQQAVSAHFNSNHLNQSAIRTGKVYTANAPSSPWVQYDAIVHMGFSSTTTGSAVNSSRNRIGGYNPDTLTTHAGWPSVPSIFLGTVRMFAGSLYSNTASCTTGVSGSLGAGFANNSAAALYAPGYDETFRHGSFGDGVSKSGVFYRGTGAGQMIVRVNASHVSRRFKTRLALGMSGRGNVYNDTLSTWADSLGPRGTQATADTAVVWTIERDRNFTVYRDRKFQTVPDTGMLIFAPAAYNANGGSAYATSIIAMTLAIADSVTGGKLIGSRSSWSPKKVAVVVSRAFTRARNTGLSSEYVAHGLASLSDSTYLKQGIDSLGSLRVPVTVMVDPDSVLDKPYEKAWWNRLPIVRYGYEPVTNIHASTPGPLVLASATKSPDPFGYVRSRVLADSASLYNDSCSPTDTTMFCLLKRARQRLVAIPEFSGKVGRFVMAPYSDYFPSNFTRAIPVREDSLALVLQKAGFSAAGIDPMRHFGLRTTTNSAGGPFQISSISGAPNGWGSNQRSVYPVGSGSEKFNWLAYRGIDEDNAAHSYNVHDMSLEFIAGFWQQPWFTDFPAWNHEFRTNFSLIVIRPGDLATVTNAARPQIARPGYYKAKWAVNQLKLINKFAGRPVINFVYPEDIEL